MSTAHEHYEALLAPRYSWMFGDFGTRVAEQRRLLGTLGVHGVSRSAHLRALDLGCGSGFQSIALAELGYQVTAVDISQILLAELERRRSDLPILTVQADLRDLGDSPDLCTATSAGSYDVAVCMGDTLTHLSQAGEVMTLFRDVHQLVAANGVLVLTFRDYSRALTGLDRFIPVRATDDATLTCALEYEADYVIVNDLLYERTPGGWEFRKSSYRKLRLDPKWVTIALASVGFTVEENRCENGMCMMTARRAISTNR